MSLQWLAIYNDGTFLEQYTEDGTENKYADIDRTKLSEFRLHRESGELVFSVQLEQDQRLIYRRRNTITIEDGEEIRALFYLVGWQMTVGDRNIQSLNLITEDGSMVVQVGKFREDHPLFAPIVPVEGEK